MPQIIYPQLELGQSGLKVSGKTVLCISMTFAQWLKALRLDAAAQGERNLAFIPAGILRPFYLKGVEPTVQALKEFLSEQRQ